MIIECNSECLQVQHLYVSCLVRLVMITPDCCFFLKSIKYSNMQACGMFSSIKSLYKKIQYTSYMEFIWKRLSKAHSLLASSICNGKHCRLFIFRLWKISQMKNECWLPSGDTKEKCYFYSHSINFIIQKINSVVEITFLTGV